MTPEEIAHIKRIPLFREIDDAVIRGVAEVGVSRDLALGEAIFRSGDPGTELYIILAGAVRIHTMEDGHELELAVLREGNYFGEMSVIDGSPRSADATVAEAGTLFVVKSTEYLALLAAPQGSPPAPLREHPPEQRPSLRARAREGHPP
jgi:CRP-like cAMP-binding protein